MRILKTIALFLLLSSPLAAEQTKTTFNPFTGKLDYITRVDSTSLPAGSSNYIWNSASLQAGATGYPDFMYIGSSVTVFGPLDVYVPSLEHGFVDASRLQFDPYTTPALKLTHENITATSSNQIQFWNAGSGEYAYIEAGGNGATHSFDIAKSSCNPSGFTCTPTTRWSVASSGLQLFFGNKGDTLFSADSSGVHSTSGLTGTTVTVTAFNTTATSATVTGNFAVTGNTYLVGNAGIGNPSPAQKVDILDSVNTNLLALLTNNSNGTAAQANFKAMNDAGDLFQNGVFGSGNSGFGMLQARDSFIYAGGNMDIMANQAAAIIRFAAGGNVEQMRISSTGFLGIGGTDPRSKIHLSSGTVTIDGNVSPAMTFLGAGAPTNSQALCLLAGSLGHCTTVVGVTGGCTCTVP